MIKKMKKLSFLALDLDYDSFLEKLRSLGVIHIVEKTGTGSEQLAEDCERLMRCTSVLSELSMIEPSGTGMPAAGDPIAEYDAIRSSEAEEERLFSELKSVEAQLEPWGEFDPELLDKLEASGCCLKFWSGPSKDAENALSVNDNAFLVSNSGKSSYIVSLGSLDDAGKLNECFPPKRSLASVREEINRCENGIREIKDRLLAFAAANIPSLRQMVAELESSIDLTKVRSSADSACEGHVKILSGWAPKSDIQKICVELDKENCLYQVSDPQPEDDVPILLGNNAFFRMFEPLTKLYMLPKYGEIDLTPFFAPFFMVFFGLCLGDIGYGLLIVLALPVFIKLFKLINPDFSKGLVLLFGFSTILCGLLSGSFFGFSIYDLNIPFIRTMKEMLYTDNTAMFTLSLEIGIVQILFGMAIKAVNLTIQFGFKHAVSTVGWLVLILTIIVSVLAKVSFSNPVIIVLLSLSAAAIFLYNSPGKNPLLNIGLGVWDTYNMATGLLGDVLSYVRLFALGLSGGILATVFNSMATGMSPDVPIVGFLVTALIFVIGHGLNIFMNILGAVVHPMRLTFVEFFKNAGYEGGGTAYKPFKEINQ